MNGTRRLLRLGCGLLLIGSMSALARDDLPERFEQVRARFQSSETVVLDRHGQPIHRLRRIRSARRGEWVPLTAVPAVLRQALLRSEDRRFYEHGGVDWQAVSAAAWANLWHERTRGASTLSMQLAGLLDAGLQPAPGQHRRWSQKLDQALAARTLERHWHKDQILEAYLNLVPFRGELIGLDALTRSLFGKAPHGVNEQEAALIAALVRAPNAPAARVAERACGVLRQLRTGADCAQLRVLADIVLARPRHWASSEGIAPHLSHKLLAHHRGDAVQSTLDAGIQRVAIEQLQQQLQVLRAQQVEDGAVVVLDNQHGEVLAWVGSSGALSQAPAVDGVMARRQPGSALKPFLYAQAIAERRLTAASLLNDSPTQLPTAQGLYMPRNHDHHFRGWVSARTALASSLNIPAVRALVMVSPEAFGQQLRKLGMPLPESGGYYGYSLALGSAEVSLMQLANAYRTLANGGWHCPVQWQASTEAQPQSAGEEPEGIETASFHSPAPPKVGNTATDNINKRNTTSSYVSLSNNHDADLNLQTPPKTAHEAPANTGCRRALDAGAAFIVGDILSDRQARVSSFGTHSVLNTPFWTAVKTGTSKDMRDNWAIGWSQHYTVAVWVGNASGAPMHQVSGVSGAAPIWARLMAYLHRQRPSAPPVGPSGVVSRPIRFGPDVPGGQPLEASRTEWFMAGTAQPSFERPVALLADDTPHAAPYDQGGSYDPDAASAAGPSSGLAPVVSSGVSSTVSTDVARDGESVLETIVHARIIAPAPGTIIALDPDIPPANQRLNLRAEIIAPSSAPNTASRHLRPDTLQWRIGPQRIGTGPTLAWLPIPGRHRLQLCDSNGKILDEIRIEVRGALPVPP